MDKFVQRKRVQERLKLGSESIGTERLHEFAGCNPVAGASLAIAS
jgi:hypothetical protein